MREIKIKVWDIEQDKFLEINWEDEVTRFNKGKANIVYSDEGGLYVTLNGYTNEDGYPYEVDAEILLFTGLNDIYEGDIVEAYKHNETRFVHEIVWRSGVLYFGNWNWIEFQNIFRNIKVIGNKFQHPHLLAKEDKD